MSSSATNPSTQSSSYRAPAKSPAPTEDVGDFEYMVETISESVKDYGSKHPLAVAGAIFCVGFYLGWKVKPW